MNHDAQPARECFRIKLREARDYAERHWMDRKYADEAFAALERMYDERPAQPAAPVDVDTFAIVEVIENLEADAEGGCGANDTWHLDLAMHLRKAINFPKGMRATKQPAAPVCKHGRPIHDCTTCDAQFDEDYA